MQQIPSFKSSCRRVILLTNRLESTLSLKQAISILCRQQSHSSPSQSTLSIMQVTRSHISNILQLLIFIIFFVLCLQIINKRGEAGKNFISRYHTYNWPFQIVQINGRYELRLFCNVAPQHTPQFTIPAYLVVKDNNSHTDLNFDHLVNIPDFQWRLPIHANVTRTYPQSIDVADAVNRLMDGIPLSQVSYFHLSCVSTIARLGNQT